MNNPKIDLYFNGDYYRSTNQSKTLKEAIKKLIASLELQSHSLAGIGLAEKRILLNPRLLTARFDKR